MDGVGLRGLAFEGVVDDADDRPVFRPEHEDIDDLSPLGIVADAESGLQERRVELVEVDQGLFGEAGADLAEGGLGPFPRIRAGERFEQPAAEIEREGFRQREGEPRKILRAVELPVLAAAGADDFLERKTDPAEDVEVAADRLLGAVVFGRHVAEGDTLAAEREEPQKLEQTDSLSRIGHGRRIPTSCGEGAIKATLNGLRSPGSCRIAGR